MGSHQRLRMVWQRGLPVFSLPAVEVGPLVQVLVMVLLRVQKVVAL